MQELIDKAATLLEALPYIQQFKGTTFVIKYGGSFMDSPDPTIRNGLARDLIFLRTVGIHPLIVHGGGKAISRAMRETGNEPQFVQGYRVTDSASAELVDRVLSEEVNPEIVECIRSLGGKAVSVLGRDILRCQKKRFSAADGQTLDLGFVGEIVSINLDPIRKAIDQGAIPIVSPSARDSTGQIYNCNADLAASRVAAFIEAQRLVYLSDVPGLLRVPTDPTSLIEVASLTEIDQLKAAATINSGMIPKIESATTAIKDGVDKVSLVDGRMNHAVLLEIFTDRGVGTQLIP